MELSGFNSGTSENWSYWALNLIVHYIILVPLSIFYHNGLDDFHWFYMLYFITAYYSLHAS